MNKIRSHDACEDARAISEEFDGPHRTRSSEEFDPPQETIPFTQISLHCALS